MNNEIVSFYTTSLPRVPDSRSRLIEEIAWLESRLIEFGASGDCAYEKVMLRSYNALLDARRTELRELTFALD